MHGLEQEGLPLLAYYSLGAKLPGCHVTTQSLACTQNRRSDAGMKKEHWPTRRHSLMKNLKVRPYQCKGGASQPFWRVFPLDKLQRLRQGALSRRALNVAHYRGPWWGKILQRLPTTRLRRSPNTTAAERGLSTATAFGSLSWFSLAELPGRLCEVEGPNGSRGTSSGFALDFVFAFDRTNSSKGSHLKRISGSSATAVSSTPLTPFVLCSSYLQKPTIIKIRGSPSDLSIDACEKAKRDTPTKVRRLGLLGEKRCASSIKSFLAISGTAIGGCCRSAWSCKDPGLSDTVSQKVAASSCISGKPRFSQRAQELSWFGHYDAKKVFKQACKGTATWLEVPDPFNLGRNGNLKPGLASRCTKCDWNLGSPTLPTEKPSNSTTWLSYSIVSYLLITLQLDWAIQLFETAEVSTKLPLITGMSR